MLEEEKLRKAVDELAKRELLQKGASEKQALELIGGTEEIAKLFVKNILMNDRLEKDMLEKSVQKMLSEDKQVARTRVWAMVETFFLMNNENPLRQIEFAEKIIALAQAQIYGRGMMETVKERMSTAKEFAKGF